MSERCPLDPHDPRIVAMLASYRRLTGTTLATPETLFDAPFVVLAHGTEVPPILWYGNRAALTVWERSWDDFTSIPSLETAEPDGRELRERLLTDVRERGISRDYTGVRVSKTGRRFLIENTTVWNITTDDGKLLGQAATFATFTRL